MKKLLLVILCLLPTLSIAQKKATEVIKSELFKYKEELNHMEFLTKDFKGGIVTGRQYDRGNYLIEHYDKELNLVNKIILEPTNERRSYNFISHAYVNDGDIILIEDVIDMKNKKIDYYSYVSTLEELSFEKELLFSITFKEILGNQKIFNTSHFTRDFLKIRFSENQKYFAISIDILNNKAKAQKLIVFDNKLNKMYEEIIERNGGHSPQNIQIDESDGSIFVLSKVFGESGEEHKDKPNYKFELHKINRELQHSIKLKTINKFVTSLEAKLIDGKLICVGFYSEKKEYRYKGVTFIRIDPKNLSVVNENYSPFTNQFVIDKYGKLNEKELRDIVLKEVYLTKNNEFIINAEEQYTTEGARGFVEHFNDIVTLKTDENGKMIWARNINKEQIGRLSSSYISIYHNDTICFLFTSSEKVKELNNNRVMFSYKAGKTRNLYCLQLSEDGQNFDYEKLTDSDILFYNVKRGLMFDEKRSAIFEGKRKKKKQLIKVSF